MNKKLLIDASVAILWLVLLFGASRLFDSGYWDEIYRYAVMGPLAVMFGFWGSRVFD